MTGNSSPILKPQQKSSIVFLSVGSGKSPKRPDVLLEGFKLFLEKHPTAELRMAGAQSDTVTQLIENYDLKAQTKLLGSLSAESVAEEMKRASALVHCSDYETFSVVCAESLSCGTPVIATRVGGMKEFLSERTGLLVEENSATCWSMAMQAFVENQGQYESTELHSFIKNKFGNDAVGNAYSAAINEILGK